MRLRLAERFFRRRPLRSWRELEEREAAFELHPSRLARPKATATLRGFPAVLAAAILEKCRGQP